MNTVKNAFGYLNANKKTILIRTAIVAVAIVGVTLASGLFAETDSVPLDALPE